MQTLPKLGQYQWSLGTNKLRFRKTIFISLNLHVTMWLVSGSCTRLRIATSTRAILSCL
jgi:hypothetical protein